MAYTASCPALAVVEYLAHLSMLPSGLMLMLIEIPDTSKIERVHSIPADAAAFIQIGDEWLDSKASPVLEVPSVLVPRQKKLSNQPGASPLRCNRVSRQIIGQRLRQAFVPNRLQG